MNPLLALALSIAILIAIWTYIALGPASLPVWAGIVAWACFFAAGGKTEGLLRTITSNLSGVFWALVALTVSNRVAPGQLPVLAIMVGVVAFAMVLQSRVAALSFIPGAFLGAATAVSVVVGAGGTYPRTIAALVAGAIFGYLSELLAGALSGASRKSTTDARAA